MPAPLKEFPLLSSTAMRMIDAGSYSLPIGKYRNVPIAEVPADYMAWALEQMTRLDKWQRDELRYALACRREQFVDTPLIPCPST